MEQISEYAVEILMMLAAVTPIVVVFFRLFEQLAYIGI